MGGALPLLVYDILITLSLTDWFLLLDWLPISSWTNFQTNGGGEEALVLAPPLGLVVLAPPLGLLCSLLHWGSCACSAMEARCARSSMEEGKGDVRIRVYSLAQ